MDKGAPSLSIIVPVLDEAALIGPFLSHLRVHAPDAELIVVDGASRDGTRSIARPLADVLISAPRGRASQMNAGAAIATGELLWFLHADSILPREAVRDIRSALDDPRIAGGCFRLRLPGRQWIYRVSDSIGNLGVQVFGFALGDHGIFCRRTAFEQSGGYPVVPILEDAELYRRLARDGRMRQLSSKIVSSPRSYEKWGLYRTTAIYFCILVLYILGVPIRFLHPFYQHLAGPPATPRPGNLSPAKAS
ncbi:MAG TPA: TIGR04283 family arsenosugar biosynthesis glycosyltransferase [Chthoniobacterales bacterium]|nr:TIGR04283 family arsenosugar biosynthesis glycosyltransferase [Chthoniobacterales bacterium]